MDGKKLLVVSDSHGDVLALQKVLVWAKNLATAAENKAGVPPDVISYGVFLGDGVADLSKAEDAAGFSCGWRLVQGNNDYGYSLPEADIFNFEGHRFFLCHGHRHMVYYGYHRLIATALASNADAVLFGHTHIPCFIRENGLFLINPGSVSRPRNKQGPTFAVLTCAPGKPVETVFWKIGKGIARIITTE
jgi:putative phosphoesterase